MTNDQTWNSCDSRYSMDRPVCETKFQLLRCINDELDQVGHRGTEMDRIDNIKHSTRNSMPQEHCPTCNPEFDQEEYSRILWQMSNHHSSIEGRGPAFNGQILIGSSTQGSKLWRFYLDKDSGILVRIPTKFNEGKVRPT